MILWDKRVVSWLLGLISGDGTIYYYKYKRSFVSGIYISSCSDVDWLKSVNEILSNHNIKASIAHQKQTKGSFKGGILYRLRLLKTKKIDQYQAFRDNIEHYGLQALLLNRKYKELCKFTSP